MTETLTSLIFNNQIYYLFIFLGRNLNNHEFAKSSSKNQKKTKKTIKPFELKRQKSNVLEDSKL